MFCYVMVCFDGIACLKVKACPIFCNISLKLQKVFMNFFLKFHLQNLNKINLKKYLQELDYYLNLAIEDIIDLAKSLQENYINFYNSLNSLEKTS